MNSNKKSQSLYHYFLMAVLLSSIGFINFTSITHKSLNADEYKHFSYGRKILKKDSSRISDSQMPVSIFNALPFVIMKQSQEKVSSHAVKEFLLNRKSAKYVTVLFSFLFAFYVYVWSKELYGPCAGLFSLFLYAFCPNIIGISRSVTTDLYISGMFLLSLYTFWKFQNHGGIKRGAVSALVLGLSQITKYTAVFLYPIFGVILICRNIGPAMSALRKKEYCHIKGVSSKFLKYVLLYTVMIIVIINCAYFFNQSDRTLGEYQFRSVAFNNMQKSLSLFKNASLFLPAPYVEGLDWVKQEDENGEIYGNIYLLENLRYKGEGFSGFKGYYFIAFLLKVPIAIQFILLMSVIYTVKNFSKSTFMNNDIFMIVPLIFLMVYFNFFFNAQIGMRILLPIFPLMYVFCGRLVAQWEDFRFLPKAGLVACLLYLIISVLSYHPHYLSYFNEIVRDRKMAYKYLADSNIDYEQNQWYLKQFIKKHPDVIVHPRIPKSGKIIVSVNHLVGIHHPERYSWLRRDFEPVDHIAYSYLVYDISEEDITSLFMKNEGDFSIE